MSIGRQTEYNEYNYGREAKRIEQIEYDWGIDIDPGNEYDATVIKAYDIEHTVIDTRFALQQAREHSKMAREKAENPGAICYDRERIRTSYVLDLADTIMSIEDAERAEFVAWIKYKLAVNDLERVLSLTGFDDYQKNVWRHYYEDGYSMATIARMQGTTKSRIQYILDSLSFNRQIYDAIKTIEQWTNEMAESDMREEQQVADAKVRFDLDTERGINTDDYIYCRHISTEVPFDYSYNDYLAECGMEV